MEIEADLAENKDGHIRKVAKEVTSQLKTNPKAFWGFTRRCLKTKAGVAPLLADPKDKESIKFDDSEKASILLKQFSSVFTREREVGPTLN